MTRDTLHTTSTSKTADGGLRNALDVVAKNLTVTLRAALSETLGSKSATANGKGHSSKTHLSTLSTARHCVIKCFVREEMKTRLCAASGWDAE